MTNSLLDLDNGYSEYIRRRGTPDTFSRINLDTCLIKLDSDVTLEVSDQESLIYSGTLQHYNYKLFSSILHERIHDYQIRSTTWGFYYQLLRYLSSSLLMEIIETDYSQWQKLLSCIYKTSNGIDPRYNVELSKKFEFFQKWQDLEVIRQNLFLAPKEQETDKSIAERFNRVFDETNDFCKLFAPILNCLNEIPGYKKPIFRTIDTQNEYYISTYSILELQAKCFEWNILCWCSTDISDSKFLNFLEDSALDFISNSDQEKNAAFKLFDRLMLKLLDEDLRTGTVSIERYIKLLITTNSICDLSLMPSLPPFSIISGWPSISEILPSERFWKLFKAVDKIGLFSGDINNLKDIYNYIDLLLSECKFYHVVRYMNQFSFNTKIEAIISNVFHKGSKSNDLIFELGYIYYLAYNNYNMLFNRNKLLYLWISPTLKEGELTKHIDLDVIDPGIFSPIMIERGKEEFSFPRSSIEKEKAQSFTNWYFMSVAQHCAVSEVVLRNGSLSLKGIPNNLHKVILEFWEDKFLGK